MKIIGLAGWSGAGKTTLLVTLVRMISAQGLRVSTIKHAHHAFDVDLPGKDSYRHREAGATEVLIGSRQRWALMHELRQQEEPRLAHLLGRLSPVDLVLVEGFKHEGHPKIEVHRRGNDKPYLFPELAHVRALITDDPPPPAWTGPVADLNAPEQVMALVLHHAEPLAEVMAMLAINEGDAG